jgi:hypothetical protein
VVLNLFLAHGTPNNKNFFCVIPLIYVIGLIWEKAHYSPLFYNLAVLCPRTVVENHWNKWNSNTSEHKDSPLCLSMCFERNWLDSQIFPLSSTNQSIHLCLMSLLVLSFRKIQKFSLSNFHVEGFQFFCSEFSLFSFLFIFLSLV